MRISKADGGRSRIRRLGATATVISAAALLAACSSSGSGTAASSGGSAPAASGGAGSASAPAIPAGDIKLGAILTMTGPAAAYSQSQVAELDTALNMINAAGGIDGHKVTLDIQDDAGSPTQAAQVALKFVTDKDAAVIYGGIPDSELQAVPVLQKYKVPVIFQDYGQMAVDPSKYPYLFATWPKLQDQDAGVAAYAKQHGWTKVAIIGDGTTFGDLNVQAMTAAFKAQGLTVAASVTFSPTATDASSQIAQAKNSGANTVAVLTTSGAGTVWSGLHAANWNPNIITLGTARYIGFDQLGSFAGTAIMPCTLPTQGPGQALNATLVKFIGAVHKALPEAPAPSFDTAPDYWLSVNIVKDAIEQANSIDPDAIKAALETWKDKVVTDPQTPITYSPTNHEGRTAPSASTVCGLSKVSADGLDVPVS